MAKDRQRNTDSPLNKAFGEAGGGGGVGPAAARARADALWNKSTSRRDFKKSDIKSGEGSGLSRSSGDLEKLFELNRAGARANPKAPAEVKDYLAPKKKVYLHSKGGMVGRIYGK